MALSALLQRYFPVVAVGATALAAYFQADAVSRLLGGLLAPDSSTLAARAKAVPSVARLLDQTSSTRSRSAQPILERNPFDSITGPLNASPVSEVMPSADATAVADASDPLGAPGCEGVSLVIVTESLDPAWSVAAMQAAGDPKPKMFRVGDDAGGKRVEYIGYNPREASPAVWLSNGGALCQALLFRKQPPVPPPAAAAGPGATPGKVAAKPGSSKLVAEIQSKIQKVSETEFNVDRSVIDKILENQAELMKQARIVPEQQDGKVVGIRLFGIRPDSLLGTLGMQNGDRLESINGFDMASPEKALEAYARLRTASSLTVKVNRRGKPVNLDFRIK